MADDELLSLDATAQAELVATGKVSPAELVDASIARIEERNPALNAVIHPLFDEARRAARQPVPSGPFAGVPLLLKDLDGAVEGQPLHMGMNLLRKRAYTAPRDNFLVQKLRAAGFIAVGKTNTPELGILPCTEPASHGPSRNPWDPSRTPGGSSGGSAAGVAAGMAAVGQASDGGGSIRIPASCCGLVGLKPSRGRVSRGPDVGSGNNGLTVYGAVTRSVRDAAAVLDCIAGAMPGDPWTAPPLARPLAREVGEAPGALKIAWTTRKLDTDGSTSDAHPDCCDAVHSTVELLGSLGHELVEDAPPALYDSDYVMQFLGVWAAGVSRDIVSLEQELGVEVSEDDVEPLTWALHMMGQSFPAPAYMRSWDWLQSNARRLAQWWVDGGIDLFLTPTVAEPPPPIGTFDVPRGAGVMGILRAGSFTPFTPPFNVSGQPGISLPLHQANGLPIGVQLVAPYAREDLLVRVASQLERERGPFPMLAP